MQVRIESPERSTPVLSAGWVGALALVLAVAPGACAPEPTTPAHAVRVQSVAPSSASPKARASYLVWLVGTKNEDPRTFVVTGRQDGVCVVNGQAEGVWIADAAHLLRWTVGQREFPLPDNASVDDTDPSHVEWGELVRAGAREGVRIEWPEDAEEAMQKHRDPDMPPNEVDAHVHLEAVIGPWLWILHSKMGYGGGAHGYYTTDLRVWDMGREAAVDAKEFLPAPSDLKAIRATAIRKLSELPEGEEMDEDAVKWTGFLPRFTHAGSFDIGYVFAMATCYACSSGPWSESYVSTVRVEGPLAPALEAYSEAPACVARFAQSHPEDEIGGWSSVSRELASSHDFDTTFTKGKESLLR